MMTFRSERVEVTLKPEEAAIFWAHLDAGGYPSKAAYARAALLSGQVVDLDQLSAAIGAIGLAVNGLRQEVDRADIFRKLEPEIAQLAEAVALLQSHLSRATRWG